MRAEFVYRNFPMSDTQPAYHVEYVKVWADSANATERPATDADRSRWKREYEEFRIGAYPPAELRGAFESMGRRLEHAQAARAQADAVVGEMQARIDALTEDLGDARRHLEAARAAAGGAAEFAQVLRAALARLGVVTGELTDPPLDQQVEAVERALKARPAQETVSAPTEPAAVPVVQFEPEDSTKRRSRRG